MNADWVKIKKGSGKMIDTKELKIAITRKDMSQKDVAIAIGMSPKTFYGKMKKGVFGSDEMEAMIDLLSIEDPMRIFFANKVTS